MIFMELIDEGGIILLKTTYENLRTSFRRSHPIRARHFRNISRS